MKQKLDKIYDYWIESNFLDEFQFEKDIYAYCKNNEGRITESKIDDIMSKHVAVLQDKGLYAMSTSIINGIDKNIDKILGDEVVKLHFIQSFVINRLNKIIEKYMRSGYGIRAVIDEKSIEQNNFEVINVNDEMLKQQKIKNTIMYPYKKMKVIDIELSAATLNETYMWYVALYNHKEKAIYEINNGFHLQSEDVWSLNDTYEYLFDAIKERKKYHNGIVDDDIDIGMKRKSLKETIKRLRNIFHEEMELESNKKDWCKIAFDNTENYTVDDILSFLKKTNFNYLDYDFQSYTMFESLIELIVLLKNAKNKDDAKKKLIKLKKYKMEYQNICDWFEVDGTSFDISENIEQYAGIPLGKVFSYAIKFYKRYYDKDEENTRELLKIFFSNAMTLSDTNFAQQEYMDLYYDQALPYHQMQFLYPTYIFKDF